MAERKKHEIAVIGSGPGGYVAAIKAAQLGKSVALIEKGLLGGTCLNIGCIPTKTLIANAAVLHQVRRASEFGIKTGPVSFSYEKMKTRKDEVVANIRKGLEGLLKSNKIAVYRGSAQFESPSELKVAGQDNVFISAEKIIIATGSAPLDIKAFPCDHRRILNSTSILELTEVPKSLAIVGGGYIGCEFASLFAELGTPAKCPWCTRSTSRAASLRTSCNRRCNGFGAQTASMRRRPPATSCSASDRCWSTTSSKCRRSR